MAQAYVLIKCTSQSVDSTFEKIKSLPNIIYAYKLRNAFDVITKISADSLTQLRDFVLNDIRIIDGILETLTILCITP